MVCSLALVLSVFRMVVIPVQFEDVSFSCGTDVLAAKVAEAERYFGDQPAGYDGFEFDLAPVVTLGKEVSYYGANYSDRRDALLHEAVRQACTASRNAVDFSSYDNDGDSEVDNIFILFAGPSESDGAGAEYIWPQHGTLRENGGVLAIGGVQINSFSVCTELSTDNGANPRQAGTGIFCHEFGHYLGLPDFYDSDGDGSGGLSSGLWGTGLMDKGCMAEDGVSPPNFSALDLDILGTGDCRQLALGSTVLQPIDAGGTYLKLPNPDDEREYFLLECRRDEGWDSLIGGSGLVIYHVDKSDTDAGYSDYFKTDMSAAQRWENNQINCAPGYECAEPVSVTYLPDGSGSIFLPCGGKDTFGLDGGASFTFHSGYRSTMVLHDISLQDDGSVSFDVIKPIAITGGTAYQDAVTVNWITDDAIRGLGSYRVVWNGGGSEGVVELPSGSRSCTIEGLSPQTTYSVSVSVILEGASYTASTTLTTRFRSGTTYPFIYLESDESRRNADGSFIYGSRIPLRLFNVSRPYSVEWYFNGIRAETDPDGLFVITEAGTLRAEVTFDDGERLTIIKEIVLK